MGAIWVSGDEFAGAMSELIGYKLGIVVTSDELRRGLADAGFGDAWPDDAEAMYRYRSEVYEEITKALLGAFGDPDAAGVSHTPAFDIVRSLPEAERSDAMAAIARSLELLHPVINASTAGTAIDPRPVLDEVENRHGPSGRIIAVKLLEALRCVPLREPVGAGTSHRVARSRSAVRPVRQGTIYGFSGALP